ncbi:MAG: efflux RND transporter periplasmic adaptor subunit [Planctomycetaceae bacterium]
MQSPREWFAVLAGMILLACSGCAPEAAQVAAPQPRPVTVLVLKRLAPQPRTLHTGSVTPWKTEDIGFEVGGRVEMILEPGTDVAGPVFDPESEQPIPDSGTVMSRIDRRNYEVRLASAQARERTAQAQLAASQRELEFVVPQQIASAVATLTLAAQEFDRWSKLRERDAATQAQLDKARADRDTAQAQLDQSRAQQAVTESQVASYQAQLEEAQEAVRQAEKDLADTVLTAPFTGQVAEVFETVGGVVDAGRPVLRLQMMDPMQVDVEVSGSVDAGLQYNDLAFVTAPDMPEPISAMIYEKATVADSATRTFRVQLLIRNESLRDGMPSEFDPDRDVRTRNLWNVFTRTPNRRPPFFVNVDGIHQDANGYYVWRVKGVTVGDPRETIASNLSVEKLAVVPGAERIAFLNVAVMRELTDPGDLNPETDLIVGKLLDMQGAPLDDAAAASRLDKHGTVHLVRERWRFRPGDVVQVNLGGTPPVEGLYVPMDTIVEGTSPSDDASVFVVTGSGDSAAVHKVGVRVDPDVIIGTHRRVEPLVVGELEAGMQLVAGGVHYLIDGEAVRVSQVVEVPL